MATIRQQWRRIDRDARRRKRILLRQVLQDHDWNNQLAAEALGLTRSGVWRLRERLNLHPSG